MDKEIGSVDFNKEVGERIRKLRQKNNYTREYLAEIVDISPKFLYEVETGKKGCSSYILYRITKALHVKGDYLLEGEKTWMEKNDIENILGLFSSGQLASVLAIITDVYRISNI